MSSLGSDERPTWFQRRALKGLAKTARKQSGEPLTSADWEAYFRFAAQPSSRVVKGALRALPSDPRCGYCGAPFGGLGGRLVAPLGYRPSRKNPNVCAMCVELAPPGGMTTEAGVLFADIRGFSSFAESAGPEETSAMLRRFYRAAEDALFPGALIDKVVGDEVMALYLPIMLLPTPERITDDERRRIAARMFEHARALLERVGYGTADGPEFEIGVGLDYGEVFIGHIGDTGVHDFTAVGDVVNTASRLQSAAGAGEVVLSSRLAQHIDAELGATETLTLKGKSESLSAHRLRWFADAPA